MGYINFPEEWFCIFPDEKQFQQFNFQFYLLLQVLQAQGVQNKSAFLK